MALLLQPRFLDWRLMRFGKRTLLVVPHSPLRYLTRKMIRDVGDDSLCETQSKIVHISLSLLFNTVVGCTDLSGKELHRPVGMGIVVTSRKPLWCNLLAHWPGMPEMSVRFLL